MKLLGPLATFTGRKRMAKKEAMAEVLNHVKLNNLFDPNDWDYVIPDEKLKLVVGDRSRVKLRKLAKKIAQFLVEDTGEDSGEDSGESGESKGDDSGDDGDSGGNGKGIGAKKRNDAPAKQ